MINVKCRFQRVVNLEAYFGAMSSNTAFEVPLVQNDTGPALRFTLLDAAGEAIAVSGLAVNFFLRRDDLDGPVNAGHTACIAFDPAAGRWDYAFEAGDLAELGTHWGDLEITYPSGVKETAYEAVRCLVRRNNKGAIA